MYNINPMLTPLHDRHWIRSVATVATRRVPLLEQELLTLTGHLSSLPVFSGVRVAQSLIFCVVYCGSIFVLLFIMLSFRRLTNFDNLFDIFKLFSFSDTHKTNIIHSLMN